MKKILVIEDDEMLNAGMCFNIQKEGYEPFRFLILHLHNRILKIKKLI